MRAAEIINLIFFTFLTGLACVWPMPLARRLKGFAIGCAGLSLIGMAQGLPGRLPPLAASVIRDWLPSPLLLLVYWQAGQFFIQPAAALQARLRRIDRMLAGPVLRWVNAAETRAWIRTYLEVAYLLCYPLVPFALGALYLLHKGRYADQFCAMILPPTYLCYVMVPFVQTLPPRALETAEVRAPGGTVRRLNLWILQHASIQANTFPSGHVAASLATALALLAAAPWVAVLFFWIAISIAAGVVIGRYHYAADVMLAALVTLAAFVVESLRLW